MQKDNQHLNINSGDDGVGEQRQFTGYACGYHPTMAGVHLFSTLPAIKLTNQMASRLFGFP